MPKLRKLLVPFALFLCAVLAHAQGAVTTSLQVGQGGGVEPSAGSGAVLRRGSVVGTINSGVFTSSGNPGQPFSADVIEENDKFLADGNHIHFEIHGRIFRDSEGRMRTETEAPTFGSPSKPFVHIVITDLAEGRFIFLDSEHKIATINHFGRPSAQAGIGGSLSAKTPQPQAAAPATKTTEQTPPISVDSSPEDLGTTQMEGFTVNGTRFTHTVAAGAMGNDKPITTVNERWFSLDLKMDLVNSSDSPDSGKHVRKLVNIRAGEPDPLLFQVPADFIVKETPQP